MNKNKSIIITFAIMLFIVFELGTFLPSSVRYLLALISSTILIVSNTYHSQIKSIILFTIFIIVNLSYFAFNKGHLLRQDILIYYTLFSCLLISQSLPHLNKKHIQYLAFLIFALVIFSLINSIIIGIKDPMAIRMYTFGSENDQFHIEQAREYTRNGLMTYYNAHMLSCLPPILVYLSINADRYWKKVFLFSVAIATIYLFALMVVTTSFLSSLICSIIVLFIYSKNKLSFSITSVLSVFIIGYTLSSFNAYDVLLDNDTFTEKITDLNHLKEGQSVGQVQTRESLYKQSIQLIYENPILGLAELDDIGDHSFFLDFYALYGLFSLIFWWAWYEGIKTITNMFENSQRKILWICLIPIIILTLTKSRVFMANYFFASFVLCPLLIMYNNFKVHYK